MYVKIVHNTTRKTKVIEASSVTVARDDNTEQVIVDMVVDGVPQAEICRKGCHTVYLMNDHGKTLDTYRL